MSGLGIWLAEHGLVPTGLVRVGIRRLIAQRVRELETAPGVDQFADDLRGQPVALATDRANEQHYELPARFFEETLGPRLKYSGCYWPDGVHTLADAERASLDLVCERAGLADGQDILELGCGWGSLSLCAAKRFPNTRVLAVSNSSSQRKFIEARATPNLRVVTADMNDFAPDQSFDRVVSIEMLEHMRNYEELFRRIAGWLEPNGEVFVHVFAHRRQPYTFAREGSDNWMGRHFFTGGLMPSHDLFARFSRDLVLTTRWNLNGLHYARTAAAWRENLESNAESIRRTLGHVYGRQADVWFRRWRLFFIACEELFSFRNGTEWTISHFRFLPAAKPAITG